MKRKVFLSIVLILLIQTLFAFPVMASDRMTIVDCSKWEGEENGASVVPFADKIVVKYRYYNGKKQYRRWNETRKCWVDPYWIDM